MEKQKYPELRFNSFNGLWNSKQIENILKIKSGMSQKDIEVEKGIYPILATGGEIGRTNTPIYEKESVLIGRKGTIDKPYYMNSPFWTVDTLFYSELSSNIDGFFVYSLFQRINWRHHNTSTGVPSLTSSAIHAIEINVPDKTEQTQIGNFFQNLDQPIALHEKKLNQTQNLKKAMLEKMFPKAGSKQPEIRLKGFSGDWEEFGLFDVALYKNGKSHESDVVVKGKYIIVNSKFISTDGVVRKFCDSQIEPLLKDDIVFVLSDVPNGKALSKAFLIDIDGQYTLNQRIACLTPKKEADAYFLYVLINRNPYFLKFDDGVGQTNLSLADMENFIALYPCAEEQIAIGQFFKQLDETLVLQQQQLQTLKNLKQAFLEKMFV